jgi:transposase
MQFIEGKPRNQAVLFTQSLEELIEQGNEVRFIDLFVESIHLPDFHFAIKTTKEGRPAYHPKDLLKLFIYGYLNHIRSSRQLEKECKRNIELMWLLKQLVPDHSTIANFRRDNEKAIRKVFRHTVSIAKHFDLIGGKLLAGDSTKLRAQNSKKNNFNENKIERHMGYIEAKLNEYTEVLAQADQDYKQSVEQEVQKYTARKQDYEHKQQQLEQSGESQLSTSDPDSRQLMTRNNICEVAYNVQTTVDAKHKLLIDYKVTNNNDSRALSGMLRRTKAILGTTDFTALYDKGYHTGIELKKAVDMGIEIMVAVPGSSSSAPDEHYNMNHFVYQENSDTYLCPQQQVLTTNGNWYKKTANNTHHYLVKPYTTSACANCPAKALCTKNIKGRMIERSEYTLYVEINSCNIEAMPELYKQRQSIVEHPYGTIKRAWGFDYIITKKGIRRASADAGLMFIAYNLKRLTNIIGKDEFRKYLRELILAVVAKTGLTYVIKLKIEPLCVKPKKILTVIITRLKRPIITTATLKYYTYLSF